MQVILLGVLHKGKDYLLYHYKYVIPFTGAHMSLPFISVFSILFPLYALIWIFSTDSPSGSLVFSPAVSNQELNTSSLVFSAP